jgi:uncharacterized protein YaeQ
LQRLNNLTVIDVPAATVQALAGLAQRSMQLQCTLQDGQMWVADDTRSVQVDVVTRAQE